MTSADYKAVITTEIRIPLKQVPEEDVGKVAGKDEKYLRKVEAITNVRIEWDKKAPAFYIHGEPKAAKNAYAKIMEQMSKTASTKGTNTTTPEAAVNLLGKEFIDGVLFRKFKDIPKTDGNSSEDEGLGSKESGGKNKPDTYVLDPINMTDKEKDRGRIMASDLWRTAHFVGWDFKGNVIRDASMVLRTQLKRLPLGQEKYLKLEMSIGKVTFQENSKKRYPLEGAKFAISEFRHLRFTKEITPTFRKEWDESWTIYLRATLPSLGYDKYGNSPKTVKIYHTSQGDDGNFYKNVWSAGILDGKRFEKTGTLEFLKAHVRGNSPFSATVYSPATSFDSKFSITINAREPSNTEIEERIHRNYRYSPIRGLLVNNASESRSGYKPLVLPKARLTHKTTWIRGDIKVVILESQEGPESTFEVKLQSNLLKKYIREAPMEVSLTDVVGAVTELFEAAEEINIELNGLREGYPTESLTKLTGASEDDLISPPRAMNKNTPPYDLYHTPRTDRATVLDSQAPPQMDKFIVMATSAGIAVRKGSENKSFLENPSSSEDEALISFDYVAGNSPKKTDFGTQPRKVLASPGLPDSPTIGISGTEVLWEGRVVGIIDEFGFGTPVLTPARKVSQEPSLLIDKILPNKARSLTTDKGMNSGSPVTAKRIERNIVYTKQVPISVPPHLRPVIKSPVPTVTSSPGNSPTEEASSSYNNFSDRFFDLLDSVADGDCNSSAGVLTPRKVSSPRSRKIEIDFFGSVEPLTSNDNGDLMSWGPDKGAFTYIHESDTPNLNGGEGVSLLLD